MSETSGMAVAFDIETDQLPKPYLALQDKGQPRHFLTSMLFHIERMACQGLEPLQIAARINVPIAALHDAAKRFEDVRVAMTGGRARGADELSCVMYQAGISGNVPAASLLLKTKHGFNAPVLIEHRGAVDLESAAPVTIDHADMLHAMQEALLVDEEEA